jgi:hypothetical protein
MLWRSSRVLGADVYRCEQIFHQNHLPQRL